MVAPNANANGHNSKSIENIAYIRQLLGELRQMAGREGAEMLGYLIEMAYVEAGDIQAGRRSLSITHGEGNKSSGMPM